MSAMPACGVQINVVSIKALVHCGMAILATKNSKVASIYNSSQL